MSDWRGRSSRLLALTLIGAMIAVGVGAVIGTILYRSAFEHARIHLVELVQSQVRLIEAVAEFDARFSREDVPGGAVAATLSQIVAAHGRHEGFGETGEFTVGVGAGDGIVFLVPARTGEPIEPIPFEDDFRAEPMRRALSGDSGSVIGPDYAGERVIAAYDFIDSLGVGVVAKMAVSEVNAPLLRGLFTAAAFSVFLIGGGAILLVVMGDRLMRQVERERSRYLAMFEGSDDGELVLRGRTIEEANQRACELLDASREQILGRELEELISPRGEDVGPPGSDLGDELEAVESGEPRSFPGILHGLEGKEIEVEVTLQLIDVGTGERILVTVRDVRERLALEAQLRQAQKMEAVGRLAGGIAHDFNNLLTGITGYSELLSEEVESPGARDDIRRIQQLSQRAAELTSQMLAFSRRQRLQRDVFDLDELIRETLDMLTSMLGEDVDVRYRCTVDEPWVHADRGQVTQVLMNLVVNSRDAMPEGGVLRVEIGEMKVGPRPSGAAALTVPGRYVVLAVRDTGLGMDQETLRQASEPFFTTKATGKGTGLGLSMAQGIVQQHGGFVKIDSTPGEGTEARVHLPASDRPPARVEAESMPVPDKAAGLADRVVLVAEDEPAVLAIMQRALEGAVGEVLLAAGVREAGKVHAERADEIDLLVSDMVMADGTGLDLAAELRRARPDLPILFVSGYPDRGGEGLDGREEVLMKPFTPGELLRRVREILQEP